MNRQGKLEIVEWEASVNVRRVVTWDKQYMKWVAAAAKEFDVSFSRFVESCVLACIEEGAWGSALKSQHEYENIHYSDSDLELARRTLFWNDETDSKVVEFCNISHYSADLAIQSCVTLLLQGLEDEKNRSESAWHSAVVGAVLEHSRSLPEHGTNWPGAGPTAQQHTS
ncbi:hypothetical protein [Streptomyces sp. NPDC093094]|uniref:hypothetical protein n=1 Tax=Streptomyces sp. NPDC093094 TaxID=3366026 RepID=UPI0037FC5118